MEKHITGMKRINPYKQFIGSFIPEWLEERSEISPGAKICYARLARFAGKDGSCFPKRETIGKSIGISQRQVDRYIKELKNQGLIDVRQMGLGRNNEYIFYQHEWMDGYYKDKTDVSDHDLTDVSGQESTDMSSQQSSDVSSPYIRESLKENHIKRGGGKTKMSTTERSKIPTIDEVKEYFASKEYNLDLATTFFNYYDEPMKDSGNKVWKDRDGRTVKSWKQKALTWMNHNKDAKIKTLKGDTWNTSHKT